MEIRIFSYTGFQNEPIIPSSLHIYKNPFFFTNVWVLEQRIITNKILSIPVKLEPNLFFTSYREQIPNGILKKKCGANMEL